MAAAQITRKLIIQSDTTGLQKGARDVQSFGQHTLSAAEMLKRMKGEMNPAAYKSLAAGMKPVIEAERQMASMAKTLTAELKPFTAELRKSQTESLKAAEAMTKLATAEMKRAEGLRRSFDTTYANAMKYHGVEQAVQRQIELRNLSAEQGNVILAGAATRYKQMGESAHAANSNIKLTGDQLLNLGRQGGDAGTMLAMGASPLMVLTTQAAQVVDALASGPNGVKGSLAAIGTSVASFARSIPVAGYAVAGVTTAVGALWYMTSGSGAREAEQTLKDYEDAIKRLETGWKDAADAARDYAKAPSRQDRDINATFLDVQGSIGRLTKDLRAQIDDLNTSDLLSGRILRPFAGGVSDARKEITSLYTDLRQGEISAQQFADEMLRIRLDPNADDYARNFAEEIRLSLGPVMELERQVQALNQAAAELAAPKGTMGRHDLPDDVFRDRFGSVGGDGRFGDSAGMDALRDGLKAQREELTKTEAATRSYSDAVAEQKASIAQSVAELRLQVDLYGESEGALAAARFKLDAMTEAQRAATDAKAGAIDPALVDQINREADEIGRLTDEIHANTEAERERQKAAEYAKRQRERLSEAFDDIAFERSILGLSDAEQQVRETIRSVGVDYASMDGQRLAGELRYNEALRETQDEMRRMGDIAEDVFGGLVDALTQGGDLMENLMGFAADLGRQFASMGAKKLFGDLFGSGQAAGSGQGKGIAGAIVSAVTGGNIPIPTPRPDYSNVPIPTARPEYQAATAAAGKMTDASSSLADVLRDGAARIGTTARDLATAISFETGGKFSTSIQGGAGNRHIGLIQFGPTEQKRYGAAIGQTLSQQMDAVVSYLQDRGFKPGMDIYDLYSTINAGRPGRHGASDAANGGTWGTVRDKVDHQFGPHYAKADSILNGTTRDLSKGVSKGVRDGIESYSAGRFDTGASSAPTGGLFGPRGQAGVQVLGAGLGAFGAGYQSGSPFSGGLSGALGGYQAAPAISSALNISGMAGGVLGVVGGAALGILGGILGARKQRAEAHKQAAAQWAQVRPQYEAFDKSLSPNGTGQIREWLTSTWSQLSGFMDIGGKAWKNGTGNSTAQFASTGAKMFARFDEMLVEFREGFDAMIEDLSSGEGLAGAFAKGRAATKDLQKQIDAMIDDVSIAFGSDDIGIPVADFYTEASKTWEEARNKAIADAKTAAGEYSLSLLYTAETNTEVEKTLDGFRGTAAGLQKVLEKLGWTAEDAAADINDRLTQAIAEMGKTFVDGFQRQINDLSGVGYFNDIEDLLKARDTGIHDAGLLGQDPAIVTDWFKLAAQDIVNGAELTGSAFDALVTKFPELANVVKAFVDTATVTAEQLQENYQSFLESRLTELTSERADAEAALRSEYERTVSFLDGIKNFLNDIALDDTLSTLGGKAQIEEAQRLYRETLFKAGGGDREAQEALTGSAQDFLEKAKAYWGDSEQYGAVFDEVNSTLKGTAAKTQTALDYAKSQASFLADIAASTKDLPSLLKEYLEAAKKAADQQKLVDGNRSFGLNPTRNRSIDAALKQVGLSYTGNYGIVNGADPFLQWRTSLPPEQLAVVNGIIQQYIGMNYDTGGYTGPGGRKQPAGVVHKGEVVWNQDNVAAWGGPAKVEAMRLGRVAPIAMPSMERAMQGGREASDQGSRAEIASLRGDVAMLTNAVLSLGVKLDEGNRRTADLARPLARVASAAGR